ncbi:outer membrane lipoprotein-sorting protein [Runella salmonicolor]|uniref:Outer membrane lipoprotein-sorting protein n=1 Tax=Runella salmonicolor TaxID=2950278 RepID=A0ABT1FQS1_9BACT|nr:outer membrane lipoprotein-sorting protein [Runella salmonicolor]MCP1384115.1 outer membrane lipoprotein-sorting protein [Runella salmonicolor]
MKTNKLLVATLAAFVSISSYAQTVDEIVDKHIAAMGGADKLKGVSTIVIERTLAVQNMEIPNKTTVVVGKALRTESSVMGNSMVQVVEGATGWMIRPAMMGGTGDPEDMPAEMVKQQAGQLDPFGELYNYKEKGSKVELVGKEKVEKDDAYHLKVTTKDGQVMEQYIDANTFMLTKLKTTINGQDGEIMFSDYKEVEGIKMANTMDMTSQMGALTFITNKVTVNAKVDEAIFKKPTK